jgi:hypothetical protein
MKITRRKLAAAVMGSAAAAVAQQSQAPDATPDAELAAARSRMQAAAEVLKEQEIPMSIEPAFQFKA